jgi:putative membrane protein
MHIRRISAALGAVVLAVMPASAARADEPSTRDAEFLRTTTQAHLAAFELGRIAWFKTRDTDIKTFAGGLMGTHIRLNAALGTEARRLKVELPESPDAEQKELIGRYEAASAAEFDELFLTTQENAHRVAAASAAAQAANGDDARVKDVARASVAVLNKQVDLIDAID